MKKLVIKKCSKCGALVKVLNDCTCDDCGITCCGEVMNEVKPNSTDAAFEKHVPTYERKENKLEVKVNHVMDDDHYIEWICFITESREEYIYFEPGIEATGVFDDVNTGKLYAYCNKHGLWETTVE